MDLHLPSFSGILLILTSVEWVEGTEETGILYASIEHTWVTVMDRRRIKTRPEFYQTTQSVELAKKKQSLQTLKYEMCF